MKASEPSADLSVEPETEHEVDEPTIFIDSSGDLRLITKAGDRRKTFFVSSKAMCLASPVWRAMLDPKGHFIEARPSNKEILCEDDDEGALSILLDITHFRFLKVPESLNYGQLLQISILCDKYDIVTLARPWLSKWVADLEDLPDRAGHEEWLFIAWAFGDSSTFERIARRLVMEITVPDGVNPSIASGLLPRDNMPPGVVGQ